MKLKIAFDAKRAFLNNSGLGNYARTIIKTLHYFNPKLKQYLYTTSFKDDDFLREITQFTTVEIVKPNSFIENKLKNYWRSYSITKNLIKQNIDVYHGLSNELPINIKKFKGKKL